MANTLADKINIYDGQAATLKTLLKELKDAPGSPYVLPRDKQARGLRRSFVKLAGKVPDIYTSEEAIEVARPGRNIAVASFFAANAVAAWMGVTQHAMKALDTGEFNMVTLAIVGKAAAVFTLAFAGIALVIDKGFYKNARERFVADYNDLKTQLENTKNDVKTQQGIRDKMTALKHGGGLFGYEAGRVWMANLGAVMGVLSVMMIAYRSAMEAQHDVNFNTEQLPKNDAVIAEYKARYEALTAARVDADESVQSITDQMGGRNVTLSAEQKAEILRIQTEEIDPLEARLKEAEDRYDALRPQIVGEEGGIGKTGKAGQGPQYRQDVEEFKATGDRIKTIKGQIENLNKDIEQIRTKAELVAKDALGAQREGLQAQLSAAQSRLKESQDAENMARDYETLAKQDSRYVAPGSDMTVSDRFRTLFQSVGDSHWATHLGTAFAVTVLWNLETQFLRDIYSEVSEMDLRALKHKSAVIEKDALIENVTLQIQHIESQKRLLLLQEAKATLDDASGELSAQASAAHTKQINDEVKVQADILQKRLDIIKESWTKMAAAVQAPAMTSLTDEQKKKWSSLIHAMGDSILEQAKTNLKAGSSNDNVAGSPPIATPVPQIK